MSFSAQPIKAAGNSIAVPDSNDSVGESTSLKLDASGNPVISYYDRTNGNLKLVHCNDPNCTPPGDTIATVDSLGDVGFQSSLGLDASGLPVISYLEGAQEVEGGSDGNLKVAHCGVPSCFSGNSIVTVDTAGDTGYYNSLTLDANGYPVVSYHANGDLRLLHCNDPNCVGGDDSIMKADTPADVGRWSSIELDSVGNPVMSYTIFGSTVKFIHCGDPFCDPSSGNAITEPDAASTHADYTSLKLDSAGNAIFSYWDAPNFDLKVVHCGNATCTAGNTVTAVDTIGHVGQTSSLALDASGNPVISYLDSTNGDLRMVFCGNPSCDTNNVFVSPDTAGTVGPYSSLVFDNLGHPVVSYYDVTNANLKLLHCADNLCSGDTSGVGGLTALTYSSAPAQIRGRSASTDVWPLVAASAVVFGMAAAAVTVFAKRHRP
jgi:hypothetical protein